MCSASCNFCREPFIRIYLKAVDYLQICQRHETARGMAVRQPGLLRFRRIAALEYPANPFTRWMWHREWFPILKELASRVLCISASSASVKHLFSNIGLTLTKTRWRPKITKVGQLATVRSAVTSALLDNYIVFVDKLVRTPMSFASRCCMRRSFKQSSSKVVLRTP